MLHQTAIPFGDMQKAIALALHEAGQTDREIADAVSTSVNDIRWWRNGLGLLENLASEAKERAEEERYTPPHSRSASPARTRGLDRVNETSLTRPSAHDYGRAQDRETKFQNS